MLMTNKIKLKEEPGETKLTVLKSSDVKIKEFDFTPKEYPGVDRRETRDLSGVGMLSTHNYEEKLKPFLKKSKKGRKKKDE